MAHVLVIAAITTKAPAAAIIIMLQLLLLLIVNIPCVQQVMDPAVDLNVLDVLAVQAMLLVLT
jgi:steroid 5-alpha reductase family enzyme